MRLEATRALLIDDQSGKRHSLIETTIFGRKSDCTIHLPDTRVSRRHAMIRHQEGEYWFYDLGSFNGSYINGERVSTTRLLQKQDRIRICDSEFVFHLGGPEEESADGETSVEVSLVPMLILVSDIKGFTRLSEIIPADELAQAIGSWYDYCNEVLSECGAAIDKFIGDAVLAYWTDVTPNARTWAIRAARELRTGCEEIYQQMRWTFDRHGASFSSGVALHYGNVAYGQMGTGGLTMLGDAVNTTFRIQALTRTLGHDVLATGAFFEGWNEGLKFCHPLGTHALRGKETAVEIFAVETSPHLALD